MAKKDGSKAHQQLAGGRKNASIMSFVTKKSDPIDDVAQQRNESISPPDLKVPVSQESKPKTSKLSNKKLTKSNIIESDDEIIEESAPKKTKNSLEKNDNISNKKKSDIEIKNLKPAVKVKTPPKKLSEKPSISTTKKSPSDSSNSKRESNSKSSPKKPSKSIVIDSDEDSDIQVVLKKAPKVDALKKVEAKTKKPISTTPTEISTQASDKIKSSTKNNNNHGSPAGKFEVEPGDLKSIQCSQDILSGLTFVLTGNLSSMDRDEAKMLIQSLGGRVTGSISSKTNYVLAGEEFGPSKLEKAKKLKVKFISEKGVEEMIKSKMTKKNLSAPIEIDQPKEISMKEMQIKMNAEAISAGPLPPVTVPWVDKYAPKTIDSVIGQAGPKSPANKLLSWLTEWTPKVGAQGALCALISGPPGIGKTTIAKLAATALNMETVELNASDARSAKILKSKYLESMKSETLSPNKKKHCVIMDEIDGISGNSDRGGLGEVLKFFKEGSFPVVCICNDRQNLKIKTLANYSLDLRMSKPKFEQVKAAIMKICFKEKLQPTPVQIGEIIVSSNCDIRMCINTLQIQAPMIRQGISLIASKPKDAFLNIFDLTKKFLMASETKKCSYRELIELFFMDYRSCPLFMYENYQKTTLTSPHNNPKSTQLRQLRAISCISMADCMEMHVRSNQDWRMLSPIAYISTAIPSKLVNGNLVSGFNPAQGGYNAGVTFPGWFGKNATREKNYKLIDKISHHSKTRTFSTSPQLAHLILPFLSKMISSSLDSEDSHEDLSKIIKRLYLNRDDLDFVMQMFGKKLNAKQKDSIFNPIKKDSSYVLPYSIDPIKLRSMAGKGKRTKVVKAPESSDDEIIDDETKAEGAELY